MTGATITRLSRSAAMSRPTISTGRRLSSASNRYTFTDPRLLPGAEVTLFSGDTVFLRNDDGNIVASRSYGESG